MSPKQIVIKIDENGDCSINGQGFQGPECEKFIKEIEQDLGQKIESKHKKEYHQRTRSGQQLRERI